MEKPAERFDISIPHELDNALEQAQNAYFVGVSQSEMIQDLIRRGLGVSHSDPPPNHS